MAQPKQVTIKRYNAEAGVKDWEIIHPKTTAAQIIETETLKVLTSDEREYLDNIKTKFYYDTSKDMIITNKAIGNTSAGGGRIELTDASLKLGLNNSNEFIYIKRNNTTNKSQVEIRTQEIIATEDYIPAYGYSLVNKTYVDNLGLGIKIAEAVAAISTDHIDLNLIATEGLGLIDGVSISPGKAAGNNNRVLLVGQEIPYQNGVYELKEGNIFEKVESGINNDNETGSLVRASKGDTNKNDSFYCMDYDEGSWVLFDSNLEIQAGSGISISGTTISIANGGVQTSHLDEGAVRGDVIALAPNGGLDYYKNTDPLDPSYVYNGGLLIKTQGITNSMIQSYNTSTELGGIDLVTKGMPIGAEEALPWTVVSNVHDYEQYNLNKHFNYLYSSIKNIRGTTHYNTPNEQTISDLYATKTRTFIGASTPSNPVDGDIWYDTN